LNDGWKERNGLLANSRCLEKKKKTWPKKKKVQKFSALSKISNKFFDKTIKNLIFEFLK